MMLTQLFYILLMVESTTNTLYIMQLVEEYKLTMEPSE